MTGSAGLRGATLLWLLLVALWSAGCASTPTDVSRTATWALDDPESTPLGRTLSAELATAAARTGVRLLDAGEDAFVARALLVDAAERTLDLQYYSIADDTTTTLLLERLLQAARRGVRVRILVDDLYTLGRDRELALLGAQPNVQVRVFNPFLRRDGSIWGRVFEALSARRLAARMHNKLWIVDNAVAVIGGRNLGDSYFAARPEADFADLDVLAVGEVVRQASRSFDLYWNSELAWRIEAFADARGDPAASAAWAADLAARAARLGTSDYARRLDVRDFAWLPGMSGWSSHAVAAARIVADAPTKVLAPADVAGPILAALRPHAEAARDELIIVSPYFVPGETGLAILCDARRRGVRVRVLTNSLASTDVPIVHAGYARRRPALLACGVELHELVRREAAGRRRVAFSSGASLHAKAIAVDRRVLLVGSMNLDPRSRVLNTEIGLLVDDEPLARRVAELFDQATAPDQAYRLRLASSPLRSAPTLAWEISDSGVVQVFEDEPTASWWRRLIVRTVGKWTPAGQL